MIFAITLEHFLPHFFPCLVYYPQALSCLVHTRCVLPETSVAGFSFGSPLSRCRGRKSIWTPERTGTIRPPSLQPYSDFLVGKRTISFNAGCCFPSLNRPWSKKSPCPLPLPQNPDGLVSKIASMTPDWRLKPHSFFFLFPKGDGNRPSYSFFSPHAANPIAG